MFCTTMRGIFLIGNFLIGITAGLSRNHLSTVLHPSTQKNCYLCDEQKTPAVSVNNTDCYLNPSASNTTASNYGCYTSLIFQENTTTASGFELFRNYDLLEVSRGPKFSAVDTSSPLSCSVEESSSGGPSVFKVKCVVDCAATNCNDGKDLVTTIKSSLQNIKCVMDTCDLDASMDTCASFPSTGNTESSTNGFCYAREKIEIDTISGTPQVKMYNSGGALSSDDFKNINTIQTFQPVQDGASFPPNSNFYYKWKLCIGNNCNNDKISETTQCASCQSSLKNVDFSDCRDTTSKSKNIEICGSKQSQCFTKMTFTSGNTSPNSVQRGCSSSSLGADSLTDKYSQSSGTSCNATTYSPYPKIVDSLCVKKCIPSANGSHSKSTGIADPCNVDILQNDRTTTTTPANTTQATSTVTNPTTTVHNSGSTLDATGTSILWLTLLVSIKLLK